ncbi:MAG TPA: hypothetical protein VFQ28_05600, partial [Gaiella sp.]|nr:hypothetical protein [Gaiella sp.]
WAELREPARVALGDLTLCAVPTSHGIGDLARALARRRLPPRVHAYFHDTDLLDSRRRTLIVLGLRLLGRRRPVADLDAIGAVVRAGAPSVAWTDVARGEPAGTPA